MDIRCQGGFSYGKLDHCAAKRVEFDGTKLGTLLFVQGRLKFGHRMAIPSRFCQLAKNVNIMNGV